MGKRLPNIQQRTYTYVTRVCDACDVCQYYVTILQRANTFFPCYIDRHTHIIYKYIEKMYGNKNLTAMMLKICKCLE